MKLFFSGRFFIFLSTLALFGFPCTGVAQEEPVVQQAPKEKERSRWEKALIRGNINISEWFDSAAEGLDLFLAGKKVTKKKNESNIRIENITTSREGKALNNAWSIAVNPRLPNVEEYWHLKFATYDEREEKRNAKNAYLRQTARQRNYGATVGLFKKLGNVRTAFQPRIELRDPLRVSHSLILESIAEQKTYEINPKLELYATPDRGVGTFQALNFNFTFSRVWTLTLINQGDYEEKFHIYMVTNGFSVGQNLTDRSALSYNLIFSSNNRPDYHLEAYNVSVGYSEVIYKKILDIQVIPNLDFQKTAGFRGAAGITLSFNFNF